MLARSYIAVLTQLVYCCLAALPASNTQSLAQTTPSLLTFAYNDTLPLPALESKTPISFPSSYIVTGSDPQVVLQVVSPPPFDTVPFIAFTRTVLQGMEEIVHDMRVYGGDGPIPPVGYILRADDVAIDIYSDEDPGDRFTFSVAETVLRGTWEILAQYGFFSVDMEIFVGSQAVADHIGRIIALRTVSNSIVATAVPAATDT